MKSIYFTSLLLSIMLGACQPTAATSTATPVTETTPPTFTPIPPPTLTITPSPTATQTAILPSPTLTPICNCTPAPSTTSEPTKYPTGEAPGVMVQGRVTLPNGTGANGISIYSAFAAYPGELIATTDQNGYYEAFIYIPGDETVRVWAKAPGYTVKPGQGFRGWYDGEFFWRHYAGYEVVRLSFIITSIARPT